MTVWIVCPHTGQHTYSGHGCYSQNSPTVPSDLLPIPDLALRLARQLGCSEYHARRALEAVLTVSAPQGAGTAQLVALL